LTLVELFTSIYLKTLLYLDKSIKFFDKAVKENITSQIFKKYPAKT